MNLVAVGQNEPFHHVLQAWDGSTGQPLPAFDPRGDRPRVDNAYSGGLPILPTFGIKWRF